MHSFRWLSQKPPKTERAGSPASEPRSGGWLPWLVVGALVWVYLTLVAPPPGAPLGELSYSAFKKALQQGRIASIEVRGDQIQGAFVTEAGTSTTGERTQENSAPVPEAASQASERAFRTVVPPFAQAELAALIDASDVEIRATSTQPSLWSSLLASFLPLALFIGLILYLGYRTQKQMRGDVGGGGPFGIGRSRARRHEPSHSEIRFSDVAGATAAKRDLAEIIEYLREPDRYIELGARMPHGVLLQGPPGTGKTLLARAVAGEAGVPFFSTTGSEFIETFVGVGAARVRSLFEEARRAAPCVIFIDELDSVGRSRGAGVGGGNDEREQTLNQILSEMDGFLPAQTVVVLAATNRPDVLDAALLRPGRFDRKVTLDLPGRSARQQILQVHTRAVPLAPDVSLAALADGTVGFAGADLQNLVNEAALLAGREGARCVTASHFERARDVIVLGQEREDPLVGEDLRRVAYHEAGHAVLAVMLPHTDPLRKVTITARGFALGATEQMPEEARPNRARSYFLDRIAVLLGGRAAERIAFGESSSGAASDLEQATRLARRMVTDFGMSERMGPASFRYDEEHVFLGKEIARPKAFSEHTAELIDDETRRILGEAEKRAHEMLERSRTGLDAVARALLEEETLDAARVCALLGAPRSTRPRSLRTAVT